MREWSKAARDRDGNSEWHGDRDRDLELTGNKGGGGSRIWISKR